MKITAIRLRRVRGTAETEGPHWEDRAVRPLDVYPHYREDRWRPEVGQAVTYFERGEQIDDHHLRLASTFLQIDTDEGVSGVAGPLAPSAAMLVGLHLAPVVTGCDPLASEYLWDVMHRTLSHGRQGDGMMAISAIDCALWDLRGKWFGVPAYRLAGGPTRETVPAYASMFGFGVGDLGMVRERAKWAQAQGYRAQKWFLRYGPMSGHEGLRRNVDVVRTVREAIGEDDDIMIDFWTALDVPYTVALAERVAEYRPRWIEEPVMADRVDSYKRIRQRISIPVAGGEHEYTRWGLRRFVDEGALDVLQPDIYWAGGLSETLKIAGYATAHDLITMPHGTSPQATLHFSATQSPIHTPQQEFLIKFSTVTQHFLRHRVEPVDGELVLDDTPGLGMELDPDRIESETELEPA
ncbi:MULTISPECIES: enolase C-terminal domain-like protein [unclassified Streptomyces]|uniref:enolase C-terminal domain-like protein n=1 Tax=unclassified Streptomyces TaxID=2593676 RepID=UPI002E280089|nr:enolase C-terminal domain-like protein [Streptomyces sp. NBC_00223]